MYHLPSPKRILIFLGIFLLPIWGQNKPNIILIMGDDWGYGDIAVYGNGKPSPLEGGTQQSLLTPNLDKMAAEGAMFHQFYVNAAVCSPTRASVMKGQFTRRHGIHSHLNDMGGSEERGMPYNLPTSNPLLPKLLKGLGYKTAHYGKWHLSSTDDRNAPTPDEYGIDEHILTVGSGAAVHEQPFVVPGWNIFPESFDGPQRGNWRAQASEEIIDSTISFIERNQNSPFYIQTWFYDSHGELFTTNLQKQPYSSHPDPLRIYYGALTDTDKHIGRLMTRLKELNLDSNTIVLFTTDNGPEVDGIDALVGQGSTAGLRGRKRSGYEGGVRVPFIVRWPGKTPTGIVDSTTVMGGTDLLQTLISLAGGTVTASDVDGEDMSDAFRGISMSRTRPLLWHLGEDVIGPNAGINRSPKVIIRDGKWKLLQNPNGSGVELYDIFADPDESNDVSGQNQSVVQDLQASLDDWMNGNTNIDSRTSSVPASKYAWPVSGCMDQSASNYSSSATTACSGCCRFTSLSFNKSQKHDFRISHEYKLVNLELINKGNYQVSILDIKGEVIKEILLKGPVKYSLSQPRLSGVYFLKIQFNGKASIRPFFIPHE